MAPKVSAIIAVYNGEDYIQEALNSILNQTYKDIEVIVVNDGSTDNTLKIVRAYENRITIINQSNSGQSVARNKGIVASLGDYIAFLDHDDIWIPEKIEYEIKEFQKNKSLGLIASDFYLINSEGKKIGKVQSKNYSDLPREKLIRLLKIKNIIGCPSCITVKKECFEKLGLFDTSLKGPEDRDMWLRIIKEYDLLYNNIPLIKYRIHGRNFSYNVPIMKKNHKKFIMKNLKNDSFRLKLKAYSYLYLDAAQVYSEASEKLLAALNALFSIFLYPLKFDSEDDKYKILLTSTIPNFKKK